MHKIIELRMNLQQRIEILVQLGKYIQGNDPVWEEVKHRAFVKNEWFTIENTNKAVENIAQYFLQKDLLDAWTKENKVPETRENPKIVGLVAAGNIPLVVFHDFLSIFISGHKQRIKLSSKDDVLLPFLIQKMTEWNAEIAELVQISEMLKNCEAYIATGSNNSGRYFDYYFGKFPNIIRRNRTSVAILDGSETEEELLALTSDIHDYFGLGCRNVTKIYTPKEYDFVPLVNALKSYEYLLDNVKYKNNFDYQLAILLLNKKFYMNGGALLMEENPGLFAPLSVVHYEFYEDKKALLEDLSKNDDVQIIVGHAGKAFGISQKPSLSDYADGVNTLAFLNTL